MMTTQDQLAKQFEAHRDHLKSVAYRMLGSWSEAEDAVQESWLRLVRSNADDIDNLGGWLTTVVSRVCLDVLRSRKSRGEEPLEAQFPESNASDDSRGDPEQEAILADSIGVALLVVLDNLNPAERVSFILHDIFAMSFSEIALIVGKSEAATRQLASRARRRVRGGQVPSDANLERQRKIVDAFLAAAHAGRLESLLTLLDPNVVLRDDRETGEPKESRGALALANQISGRAHTSAQPALVNGTLGVIVAPRGTLLYVLAFTIKSGTITEIDLVSNPDRIRQLQLTVLDIPSPY
mgnify:CR=1 FL=1